MDTRNLPDIIYLCTSQVPACVITDIYHLGQSNNNCPSLNITAQLSYIMWVVGFDWEF